MIAYLSILFGLLWDLFVIWGPFIVPLVAFYIVGCIIYREFPSKENVL